ncbi:GlxA family transcriptional regulator [Shimia sediminis]|uniref:GlxA family transcriptional regulator n=1 Tax=Shimia sediminis TaxID=2497945 RepID=UPI000F8E8374|nr:GlxA family transcriptional regulator [Shimia sediminis]
MSRSWVPRGVAFCEVKGDHATQGFTFILLPNLSMNAFSSAIEPLRVANQVSGKELFRWQCVSEDGQPVTCSNGVPLGVDGTLDDIPSDDTVLVCSGVLPEQTLSSRISNLIRQLWRKGQTVGGVCTGAYTLARAGILRGSTFTLHWENIPAFGELYPELEPAEQVFVFDKRIWTCAGGFAGTDMMVTHIHERFGRELAGTVANMCLYRTPRSEEEPQKASAAAAIGVRNAKLVQIIDYLEEHIAEDFNLDEVAYGFDISRRQMERLFKRYLSTSPRKHLMTMRLHRARALMSETNMSVTEVAAACGFISTSHFSKRFRDRFGTSPHRYSLTVD